MKASFTDVFGELFPVNEAFGLPLPIRCAETFAVTATDVCCAGGEVEADEGTISAYDDRS
jgi:tellurite resistance protein